MTINLVNLILAFENGSMQTETAQTLKYDTLGIEPYNLYDMDFDIQVNVSPPIPPQIGSFKISERVNY